MSRTNVVVNLDGLDGDVSALVSRTVLELVRAGHEQEATRFMTLAWFLPRSYDEVLRLVMDTAEVSGGAVPRAGKPGDPS